MLPPAAAACNKDLQYFVIVSYATAVGTALQYEVHSPAIFISLRDQTLQLSV